MSEAKETKGEVTTVTPANQFRSMSKLPLIPSELHVTPAVYSTVSPDTPEKAGQLYDMMIEGGENAAAWVNRTFIIKDMLIHPVSKINEQTGEVKQLPRIVIVTDAGDKIQFASEGIWASLVMMQVCQYHPFGSLKQAFTLARVPVGKDKSMFKLLRAEPPIPEKADPDKRKAR